MTSPAAIAKKICPTPLRKLIGKFLAPWTVAKWHKDAQLAYEITNGKIIDGPFKGMAYINQSGGSILGAKLLGTYEQELNNAIAEIISDQPKLIIDIGSAEGYYAVGLCHKLKNVKMIAFEADEKSHIKLTSLAKLNAVTDQIDQRGICDSASLNSALESADNTVVICDIEGAEKFVLDIKASPKLKQCKVLVEIHELLVPNVDTLINDRFKTTHNIQIIKEQPRTIVQAKTINQALKTNQPDTTILRLLSEMRRDQMQWFWMTPK